LNFEENAELKELIRKTALLNAIKHDGKAQLGPVIGKVIGEKPELKTKAKELSALVGQIISEVNSLPLNQQKSIIEEKWPEALMKEKVEEEKRLPPLPNVEKYSQVVTRFSPKTQTAYCI